MKYILTIIMLYALWLTPAIAEKSLIPHGQIQTEQILKIFWQRVDEGKVILFKNVLKRETLNPVAVRVTQPLDNTIPTVSVISEVGGKIYYPGMGKLMRVTDAEIVLGPSGEVVDIKASSSSARQ